MKTLLLNKRKLNMKPWCDKETITCE